MKFTYGRSQTRTGIPPKRIRVSRWLFRRNPVASGSNMSKKLIRRPEEYRGMPALIWQEVKQHA
jgi:hypothetical protein